MQNASDTVSVTKQSATASDQPTIILMLLHLVPGALATLVYILTAPLAAGWGYPTIAALYVPMTLAVIVFELGFLFYKGNKRNGHLSLHDVVLYRERIPWWQYVGLPFLILLIGIIGSGILSLVDNALLQSVFNGLPDWYLLKDVPELGARYSRQILLTLFGFALVLNVFVGPIVEELYFRGYLLPRLERFGWYAPLINGLLFSFYHFWTPWQFFSRLALVLPLTYTARWKRNIYVGMIAHCTANLIGTTVLFLSLMR